MVSLTRATMLIAWIVQEVSGLGGQGGLADKKLATKAWCPGFNPRSLKVGGQNHFTKLCSDLHTGALPCVPRTPCHTQTIMIRKKKGISGPAGAARELRWLQPGCRKCLHSGALWGLQSPCTLGTLTYLAQSGVQKTGHREALKEVSWKKTLAIATNPLF